jgi:diketogulonate reductase-like aldo/keto reductase
MPVEILQRPIPSTGELLPVVGLGSWIKFDVSTSSTDRAPLKDVLVKMNELGGTMIDASPMYGKAEQVIGELTHETGAADDFFYATKVWTTGKQAGVVQMQSSLSKMKRKSMNLMQVHNLVDVQTHLSTLRDWKERGVIRYLGITHYTTSSHEQLEQLIKSTKIDFVQFNYSIKTRNAELRLLDAARDRGVAVIINEPLEKGALFSAVKGKQLPAWAAEFDIKSWGQYFLKYIIAHPAVNCVIPGTSNPQNLVDNIHAGYGRMPDEKIRKKMVAYLQNL